ncbi:MAG TPA: response regulator [Allosphingosinicella sp.]|nr:response regulator [Allosphingosinicella sp.]
MVNRRAYIIEDEKLLRDLVRQSLADCCTQIEEYDSAESFLSGHEERPAGCIIVDINLPGINGLDLLEVIAKGRAAYPVIVVSGNGNVPHAMRAGRLGVVDFIEKPFRVDQLVASVEKGFALLESQPMSRISALSTLTPREKEVLVAFADGAPNKIVAHDLGLSVRTVELHRANLMKKLGVRSLSQALLIAKDGGYV